MNNTVWITGVTGFTGCHLVNYLNGLTKRPHIVGFGRTVNAPPGLDKYYQVDINDQNSLMTIAGAETPSGVIHLASVSPPVDDAEMWHINVGGVVNLIHSLAASDNKKVRIISIGSAAEYLSSADAALDESSLCGGMTLYGKTKWAQSTLALSLGKNFGIPVIIARPFNLLGPGLPQKFIAGELCAQFVKPEIDCITLGNIRSERDFVDVRDAVDAYWKILEKGVEGEIYNVCSGRPTSIEEIISIFSRRSKLSKKIVIDQQRIRCIDLDCVYGSYKKLHQHTDWIPRISLEKSISDMLDEALSNQD